MKIQEHTRPDEFDKVEKQLNNRPANPLARYFELENQDQSTLFINSPNDLGVKRNGGVQGAHLGPKAIIYQLGKMQVSKDFPKIYVKQSCSSSDNEFLTLQNKSSELIKESLHSNLNTIIQLGGGHDHIYPFLMALESFYNRPICVLNIDAHCDTRLDELFHSGTPFRQFSKETKNTFHLLQLGIHDYSNTEATKTPLSNGNMKIFSREVIQSALRTNSLGDLISQDLPKDSNTLYVLSLDCDGIRAIEMPAVSAPNPYGLSSEVVLEIIKLYKQISTGPNIFGIYEFNPFLDNKIAQSAKLIAHLTYNFLS